MALYLATDYHLTRTTSILGPHPESCRFKLEKWITHCQEASADGILSHRILNEQEAIASGAPITAGGIFQL